ncbi:rhomboid family intramembrane serine protease [bacterium]|nr:rhomboid family intramembrane serine protease [bacterium]
MIPLKDTIPSQTYPFVNYFLISANCIVFLFELALGPELEQFIQHFGVIPGAFTRAYHPEPDLVGYLSVAVLPLFSSLFLHGGWFHLIGNMLFLYIFGDNVEDRLGHFKYLVFYLLCGVLASLGHVVMNLDSLVPTIGASGAIAGVLGAYVVLYPWARVRTLIFIFIFFDIIEIPAIFFIVIWFMMQVLSGFGSIMSASSGGVAWFAHIGGFLAGLLGVLVFRSRRRPRRPPRLYRHEVYPWD